MENNLENILDDFVENPNAKVESIKADGSKKVILDEREGLIERVDRVFVTKDGKQLLREQY